MKRNIIFISIALALAILISACGGGETSFGGSGGNTMPMAPQADMAGEYEMYESISDAGGGYYDADGKNLFNLQPGLEGGEADAERFSDKIIYSGWASIETLEFDQTLADISRLIDEIGGFIQSSHVSGNDYHSSRGFRSAEFVIRIPSDSFGPVMEGLDRFGNVPYSSTNANNITMQYVDTQARLTAREAEEARLLELLSQAANIEDLLTIERHLSNVRYEIESLTGTIRNWDSLISYSTLTLSISEVRLYTDREAADTPYGQQLVNAFNNSLAGLARFFMGAFRFLVGAFPVLVVLAVLAVPVAVVVRRVKRKKDTGDGS